MFEISKYYKITLESRIPLLKMAASVINQFMIF